MVPRQGPINGSQKRTTTILGFIFLICFPTFSQLNGFMEFILTKIFRFFGAGSVEYCDVPGNRNPGY
jgi:hypothetical protein